nr:hypothetical protein [Tanacetum cinerariifolium]
MDLFACIHHVDPTKVRIGEREDAEVHVVNEESGDLAVADQIEVSDHVVQDEGVGIVHIEDEVPAAVAEKAKGPNQRTQNPAERFVVLSDSPCHSRSNVADAEVSSVVRSPAQEPPILTTTVVTTVVVVVSSVLVPRVGSEPVHASIFVDSTSVDTVGLDVTRPSQPVAWLIILLLCFFPICVVRMRLVHTLREKKKFEGRLIRQVDLLKERDAEVASLKAQLSLKEAEAAEAIRLCSQVASVEAAEAN